MLRKSCLSWFSVVGSETLRSRTLKELSVYCMVIFKALVNHAQVRDLTLFPSKIKSLSISLIFFSTLIDLVA